MEINFIPLTVSVSHSSYSCYLYLNKTSQWTNVVINGLCEFYAKCLKHLIRKSLKELGVGEHIVRVKYSIYTNETLLKIYFTYTLQPSLRNLELRTDVMYAMLRAMMTFVTGYVFELSQLYEEFELPL